MLCAALSSAPAPAQTLVSNNAQYLAALTDPNVTHIRITEGSTIFPLYPQWSQYVPATTGPFTLDGQLDADGARPVLDGSQSGDSAFAVVLHNFDLYQFSGGNFYEVVLDRVENLIFRGMRGLGATGDAGAAISLVDKGSLLNGLHNVHFEDNSGRLYGAVAIGGDGSGLSGGIHASSFLANRPGSPSDSFGGAVFTTQFSGGIHDTEFIGNWAGTGGALAVSNGHAAHQHTGTNTFSGGVHNGLFRGNSAWDFSNGHGGAILVESHFSGGIHGSEFSGNSTDWGGGGGLYVGGAFSGGIHDSRFIRNQARQEGGAMVVAGDLDGGIHNSLFIENRVNQWLPTSQSAGLGGVASLNNSLELRNSTFLINSATTSNTGDPSSGLGGAIFHRSVTDPAVYMTIRSDAGKRTLFYGNTHNPGAGGITPNAIHLANRQPVGDDRYVDLTIWGDGRTLMLDPLSAQENGFSAHGNDYGNLSVGVRKTDSGDWYLGGNNLMRGWSTWNVDTGSLILTTVDYGGSTGVQQAHVNLPNGTFYLHNMAGTALRGSGSITANIMQLQGTISPEVWVNTGPKADAIAFDISDDEIAKIDVSKAAADGGSEIGTLFLAGYTIMARSRYDVDINVDANTGVHNDLLDVTGALSVSSPSTVNVKSLGFSVAPQSWPDGNLAVARVISTTDGITGGNLLAFTVGNQYAQDVDFLQVHGGEVSSDGKHYDLTLGLSWYSRMRDASNAALAHGDFTVKGDTFTLNGDLITVPEFAGSPTAKGWAGDTLNKKGEGTLILNGKNTYAGLTRVEEGSLWVGDANFPSAEIAGDVQVDADAILSGTGRIRGNAEVSGRLEGTTTVDGTIDMLPGSTLAPGFSIGETRTAHLNLRSGSTYEVEIDAQGESDLITVRANGGGDGKAIIEPNVTLRILNDASSTGAWQSETTYTLIDTDQGVSGMFDVIDNTLAFLDHEVRYDDPANPRQVLLLMTRNETPFDSVCQTFNQCETSGGLDDLEAENPNHDLIKAVEGLTPEQARNAFDNLSGEIYGSTRSVLMEDRNLRDALTRRMISRTPQGQHLWIDTWGQRGSINGNANEAKVSVSGMGLALGIDRQITPSLMTGAFVAYEDRRITNGNHRNARSDVEGFSAGVYAAGKLESVEVRAGAAVSRLDMDVRRDIAAGNLQGRVKSNAKSRKVQLFAEAARPITVNGNITVSPYVNVAQSWLRTNATQESGNAAALHVERQSDRARFTTLGARAKVDLPTQTPITLTADLGWVRAFGDTDTTMHNRFVDTNARFNPKGVSVGRNRVLAGVGLQAQVSANTALSLGYQGQFGSGRKHHAAQLQVRVQF